MVAQRVCPNHTALSLTILCLLYTNHSLVNTFQLKRTANKKQNYKSQKARLDHLGTLLLLWTKYLMDWALVPLLVGVGAYILSFTVRMVLLTWHQLC